MSIFDSIRSFLSKLPQVPVPTPPSEIDLSGPTQPAPPVDPDGAPDNTGDEVDDPNYDVDHTTPDDDTPRVPLDPPNEAERQASLLAPPDTVWTARQQLLKDLGFYTGQVDGKAGPLTRDAVKAFQKKNGLAADGLWGPKTEAAARKAKSAPVTPEPKTRTPGSPYVDMLGDVVLDDAFFNSFVDLTAKSNVKDKNGYRRKGKRKWSKIFRKVEHQTAFRWKPYRTGKYSKHHEINAHVCYDVNGAILIIHPFDAYLWTANSFNEDCISCEMMGNFEGELGTGNWYKPDKFGRNRPERIQLVRSRQLTKWLLDPTQGPADDKLPKPLRDVREAYRRGEFRLRMTNPHKNSAPDRDLDCGSEAFYHTIEWAICTLPLTDGGPGYKKGSGHPTTQDWRNVPVVPPLPAA